MLENEKLRYLVAGAWNTFFGWLAFTLLWTLLYPTLNLWAISGVAHLLATTQAFFVQRHLVFRKSADAILPQFLKFQFAYLILLGVGALVVNALAAQAVDPRLAQFTAMALLAVAGFVLGKSFTFNPDSIDLRALPLRFRQASAGFALPIALLVVSLTLFELLWGSPFYRSTTHIGHDFTLTGVGLLEGKYWIETNGLIGGLFNPPWFTPAWCAGAAYYADPQSVFYSPLQWFALWVDPFTATHLDALLYAVLGFVGTFVLARRVGGWTIAGAAIFATIGMANNFLPLRSAVGEAGYQPWPLWPWLALALCWPALRGWRGQLWPTVGVALALTAWLQFGFGGMLVPGVLAVVLLCCAFTAAGCARAEIVAGRLAGGGVLALILNGSRIYESLSLLHQFPRDFYALPGFAHIGDALAAIGLAMFAPSQTAFEFAYPRMMNVKFTAFPHEWALGFGGGALAVAIIGLVLLVGLRRSRPAPSKHKASAPTVQRILAMAIAIPLLLVPILLLWDTGPVRTLIKQIPILNSAAWPMRWIIVYLPLTQWLLAWPAQRLTLYLPQRASLIAAAALALIWLGPAREPLQYYFDPSIQFYDPKPVMRAFAAVSNGVPPVPITRIAAVNDGSLSGSRNDTMLDGASQGYCYNPIYGYRLEGFPQIGRLHDGAALDVDPAGRSAIYNPACLVHPAENSCTPGDGFRMNDAAGREQAERFLARKPFDWRRPRAARVLAIISQITFWMILSVVALTIWSSLLRAMRVKSIENPA